MIIGCAGHPRRRIRELVTLALNYRATMSPQDLVELWNRQSDLVEDLIQRRVARAGGTVAGMTDALDYLLIGTAEALGVIADQLGIDPFEFWSRIAANNAAKNDGG